MATMCGMFFSFDGIDGTGKSTQMELFCEWLEQNGHEIVTCRDPGSSDLGEKLRNIILHETETQIDAVSEMLLYMAARSQLVAEVIRPALESGKTIVSDRFLVSNVAYQGYAGGVAVRDVWNVGAVATSGIRPDLTIVLDMPVEQAASRLNRELDRVEARGAQWLGRVRDGFLAEAAKSPDEIAVIDAARDIQAIHDEIRTIAQRVIDSKREVGE